MLPPPDFPSQPAAVRRRRVQPDLRQRLRRKFRHKFRHVRRRVQRMRVPPALARWLPPPVGINAAECLRMALGIGLGLLVTALLSRWWGAQLQLQASHAWMVASLGASAVLAFGMPNSPLAQPWPLLGGSVVCLLCAALCQALLRDDALALALSVMLSVASMVLLRCLHPPGVGLAAFVVLEHAPALELLLFPLLFNVCVLLACAVAYNRLTGRSYPHTGRRQEHHRPAGGQFTEADLDAALGHYNQVLDISRADLEGLLHRAGRAAFERTLGDLRCEAVMSQPVVSVPPDMPLQEAWELMRSHQIKALPVVDGARRVLGMVAHADFVRFADGLPKKPAPPALGQRLRQLLWRKAADESGQRVQDIMSSPVQTVRTTRPVMALVPLFSREGHHHLPVLDGQEQLVGIITQTDLIRVLAATVAPQTPLPD